ncbi:MAG: Cytochrome c-type protein SHP [Burkholderiaceae bacterium]|nr:Cytochrome c-type protein SHP [Burkholderiaceae bacterium]
MPTMSPPNRTVLSHSTRAALAAGLAAPLIAAAGGTTPAQQLARFATAAGIQGQAERGRAFFIGHHGGQWSCASCHGNPPTAAGRHASTGKSIDPLAPGANAASFSEAAKVDKWFRRNCKDVLQRECSAAEKADVLAYLISLDR